MAGSLGKMPTTLVRRRLISPLIRSSGFVDQILRQWATGKPVNGEEVLGGLAEHLGDLGELALEHAGDLVELGPDVVPVGLSEDRADRGGDHLRGGLRVVIEPLVELRVADVVDDRELVAMTAPVDSCEH